MNDFGFKLLNAVHGTVSRITGGRIGRRAFGMPVIDLTTIGRKSGQPRTSILTVPVEEDGRLVLVASRGGDDRHPAWFLNLRENPEVTVTDRAGSRRMLARVASPEEKAELWPRITASYKGYARYQARTERDIPVVILEPATSEP